MRQLSRFGFPVCGSLPASPFKGECATLESTGVSYVYTGTEWVVVGIVGGTGTAVDYGIVEALPTGTIAKGSVCKFKAATGIYWDLLYTAEATYPWAKIGGPPLLAQEATLRETSSNTFQTTGAPSMTTPLAGEYRLVGSCAFAQLISSGSQAQADLVVFTGGTEGKVGTSANASALYGGAPLHGVGIATLAKSVACQARYRSNNSMTFQFHVLGVELDPLRVG